MAQMMQVGPCIAVSSLCFGEQLHLAAREPVKDHVHGFRRLLRAILGVYRPQLHLTQLCRARDDLFRGPSVRVRVRLLLLHLLMREIRQVELRRGDVGDQHLIAEIKGLIEISSQTVGPSLAIWANPVQFSFAVWTQKGVRLAQQIQVGPCIPVGMQL